MSQIFSNSPGPRAGLASQPAQSPGTFSPQDAVPLLYPAVGPSKTLETVVGPATLFVAGDPGIFTVTGNNGEIIVHRELAGATGVYLLTGNAGVTRLTHSVAGAPGIFAETGNAAGITVSRKLAGVTGAFGETGNDGLFKLVISGGSVQNFLAGDTGIFALVGNDGLFKLVARPEAQGGISGYLKERKMYQGGNLMLEPMSEATARAERIMVGWRDDEETMLLIQIINTFYN